MNASQRRKQKRSAPEDAGDKGYVTKREAVAEIEALRAERDALCTQLADLRTRAAGLVGAARALQAENTALRAERVRLVPEKSAEALIAIGPAAHIAVTRFDLGEAQVLAFRAPSDEAGLHLARAIKSVLPEPHIVVMPVLEPIEDVVQLFRVVPDVDLVSAAPAPAPAPDTSETTGAALRPEDSA